MPNTPIQDRIQNKSKELEQLQQESNNLILELEHQTSINPEEIVKSHILGLKKYNELKDVAMGLITMIADQRQLKISDILKEMEVEKDEK
ncbi:hypothetical protein BN7_6435 [Wickerhamomyces ciferrii]|uniref:Uncharacterized protein n=1 Tax=Wickerhamomyces ciferrii (strain ATCC 14091 / BCRC 22168 / CBS 111 / JCM 3599 / NBRC 0793 / NRRL Y-1031 F-60-10) TaxID=1206466 RepID=K0KZS2_WICCF|nr:uncharacterized protein BN7_6435 [Wickerhamomyces ciferrii]CCH46834.1 hypothetical protein BN7_6435 [Wickerhamomyces ciferrii]